MQTKNKTFYKTFGEALKDVLKQRPKAINQTWLGEQSGKGKSEVSLYANDKKLPVKETREQFGDLLGVMFIVHGNGQWEVRNQNKKDYGTETRSHPIDKSNLLSTIRDKYGKSIKDVPPSRRERVLLIEFLQEQSKSLSEDARVLYEALQRLYDLEINEE